MQMKIDRELLKQLRTRKLWTQEQLAANSGIHPRTIQRIERDGSASLQSCISISQALEVEPQALEMSTVTPSITLSAMPLLRKNLWLTVLAISVVLLTEIVRTSLFFPTEILDIRLIYVSMTSIGIGAAAVFASPRIGLNATLLASLFLVLLPAMDFTLSASPRSDLLPSYLATVMLAQVVPLLCGNFIAKFFHQQPTASTVIS